MSADELREEIARTVERGHHGNTVLGPCPGCWAVADALLSRYVVTRREHLFCLAVRPISAGGEGGSILCSRELGHDGPHQNRVGEWA